MILLCYVLSNLACRNLYLEFPKGPWRGRRLALWLDALRPGAGVAEALQQPHKIMKLLYHLLKYSCGNVLSAFMFRGNTDGSDVLFTGTKKGVVEEKKNHGQPRDDAPGA